MEGFIINPSGDFDSKLLSFAQETVQNDAGEDMLDNLQCMYKNTDKWSAIKYTVINNSSILDFSHSHFIDDSIARLLHKRIFSVRGGCGI